jgi:circadian clock protein KaiC
MHVLSQSPVDLYIDEWAYRLLDLIERTDARRIVIDSLGDLRLASPDTIRFRELLYSLVQRCSRRGVSMLFTLEVPELFGLTQISEFGVSHLSDNVVVLQYVRIGSDIKRTLTVLKTRASDHAPEVREFRIERAGLILGDPVVPSGNQPESA